MAQEFNTNLISVASNFLEELKVPFTKRTLKRRLEENPYYPSLYSLCEIFNMLNIDNRGLKIERELLDELPLPFLAYINIKEIGGKDFVNVSKIKGNYVTYYDGQEKTIPKTEFLNRWQSNIVFLAQINEKSGEIGYEKNKRMESKKKNDLYLFIAGVTLLLANGIYNYIHSADNIISSLCFLFPTLVGLTVSVLLLIYEMDKSNAFVKNICTGGVKTNCNAILGSKAAKNFGISWSEMGFFYFCFLFLYLLLPSVPFSEKKPILSYLSILSAVYIPYSVFYQYKIARQWCRLCLMVQAIFFLNLVWVLFFGDFIFQANLKNILFFICCSISPLLLWYSLKPVIIKAKDGDKFSSAYKRLSAQPGVFNLTLAEQPEASDGWQNLGVRKGNPNAANIILKVCSPACGHCFISHAIFNEVLEKNSNVRLVILYDISIEEDNFKRFPVRHFLALAELGKHKQTEEAMDYWYLNESRNYETLKQKFPVEQIILEQQEEKIRKMRDWCVTAEIEYTPTVFINGKKLPETFNLSELKNIF